MLVIYWLILSLIGAAFFLGCAVLWVYAASRKFREPRAIICPETLRLAEVKVDGAFAARTALAGHQELRVTDCSHWPERQACEQACTPQIPLVGDDRRLTRFAAFGLSPRFLRINNPVQMSYRLYTSHALEFARQAAQRRAA